MRFILRCIISLGLLYAVILRDEGYLVDPARMTRSVIGGMTRAPARGLARDAWVSRQASDGIATAGSRIAARIADVCRGDPAACLADAAMLAAPAPPHRVSLGAGAP